MGAWPEQFSPNSSPTASIGGDAMTVLLVRHLGRPRPFHQTAPAPWRPDV